jgi:hypothetical protein
MRTLALLGALAATALAGLAHADATFKNLQFLPKTIPRDELKAIMKAQARALGVECDHCHDMPDAAKDTERKKVARTMMKMQNELNAKWLKSMDKKVTCETCHRGKEKPEVVGK